MNTLRNVYKTLLSFCRTRGDRSEHTSHSSYSSQSTPPCERWVAPFGCLNTGSQCSVHAIMRPKGEEIAIFRDSVVKDMRAYALANLSKGGMLIGHYFVAEAAGIFDGYGLSLETLVEEGVFASGAFTWQDILTPVSHYIYKMNFYLDQRFLDGMCFLISRGLSITPLFALNFEEMTRIPVARHPAGIQIVNLIRYDLIGAILAMTARDAFVKGTDVIGFVCAIASSEQCEQSAAEWLTTEYTTRNITDACAGLATTLFEHLKRKHQTDTLFSILYNHTQIRPDNKET